MKNYGVHSSRGPLTKTGFVFTNNLSVEYLNFYYFFGNVPLQVQKQMEILKVRHFHLNWSDLKQCVPVIRYEETYIRGAFLLVKKLLIFLAAGVVLASELIFLGRFLVEGGVLITVDPRNLRICSPFSESSSAKAISSCRILSCSSLLARSSAFRKKKM